MVVRIGQNSARPRKTFFREWREFRGLTQEQLAERVGTNKSGISKIENGSNRWNEATLYAWADALSCEPQDLIARDPNAEDLRALLEKATPETKEMVRRILKAG